MDTWGRAGRQRQRDDRGDSLIEVLFAVVIIALAAVPLIGALLESIAASAEHRGIATTSTLLETFAETAVSEIETSPLPGGTAYTASASPSYRLLSNPSKASGPGPSKASGRAGTTVTVFVTGFSSASTFSVTVGGPTHTATVDALTTYPGGARITFMIPTLPPSTTPYPITVKGKPTTRTVSSLPGTGFQVTTTSSSALGTTPYLAYKITLKSITCWPVSGETPVACSTTHTSGLQYLTFSGKGPSGSLGTLGVVVRDPNHT